MNILHIVLFNSDSNSGITSCRVLDGELLYTKILEFNLFVFAYRLFHEDFSRQMQNKLNSRIFVLIVL